MNAVHYRQAGVADAPFIARTVATVSHGVVGALLDGLLPGISAERVLTMVLGDTSSQWSYTNCVLGECDGAPVALLFAYPAEVQEIPPLMRSMISKKRLDPLVDILTAVVPDSLYINTLWVAEPHRGTGVADALLDYAASWALAVQARALSLFAWRDNPRALAFYARHGFTRVRSVFVPKELWPTPESSESAESEQMLDGEEPGFGDLYERPLPAE